MTFHPITYTTDLLDHHAVYAYPILFLGAYIEILLPFAFFMPGEVFFFAGGILSAVGKLNIFIVALSLIAGSMLGDISNFFLGRRNAGRLEEYLKRRRFTKRLYLRGQEFFHKHGEGAVFLSRFIGVVAWVVAFFAGASGMKFRRFMLFSPPSVIIAVSIQIGIGYGIGLGYTWLNRLTGGNSWIALVAPILVGLSIILGPILYDWYKRWRNKKPKTHKRSKRT